jgi:uncharacterized damage-inducible protein DinB
MPGPVPPVIDERHALLAFLAEQRQGLRYAVHGVTDEQATARSTVSELTLGGLVKHVAICEQHWMVWFVQQGSTDHFFATDDYERGFALGDGETLADVLERYDEVAAETEKIVADLPDLGAALTPTPEGIPWLPAGLVYSPRWVLLHLIEETARHAGHADIIRESLDGGTRWALMAAAEGWDISAWA